MRSTLTPVTVGYLFMVLNLIVQNDSVGFIWRQPGQTHGARCGRHQVNCRNCRWSCMGHKIEKVTCFFLRFYLFIYF